MGPFCWLDRPGRPSYLGSATSRMFGPIRYDWSERLVKWITEGLGLFARAATNPRCGSRAGERASGQPLRGAEWTEIR